MAIAFNILFLKMLSILLCNIIVEINLNESGKPMKKWDYVKKYGMSLVSFNLIFLLFNT